MTSPDPDLIPPLEISLLDDPPTRSRSLSRKREALRDALWPDAPNVVWSRRRSRGFTTVPRILPLVMRLQCHLESHGDPSKVYLDLWLRAFDEGMVTVRDEEEMAYGSGYSGTRAVRTWREHINSLVHLGFIRIQAMGNREIAQILLLDPIKVATRLRADQQVPDEWWIAFVSRANEVGADIEGL